jgi:hypothetical protein
MFEQAKGNRQAHLSDANDANVRTHTVVLLCDKGTRGRDKSWVYSM